MEITYDDSETFILTAEFLRIYSPSAEVRGHGSQVKKIVTGKRLVQLITIKPTGNYALKLIFDDGHDSGLFTWEYLYELASEQENYWQAYLEKLHHLGKSRDQDTDVVNLIE